MNQKGLVPILIVLIIAVVALGGYFVYQKSLVTPKTSSSTTPNQVACTQDAKLCPDGTSVGRTGPNCEFAPCPTPSATSSAETEKWKILTSANCGIEVRYPRNWNAYDLQGNKQESSPEEYCIEITAPNYISRLGEEAGGVIRIKRIPLGSTLEKATIKSMDITINSITDYKKYLEQQFTVQDLGNKSYSNFSGKVFNFAGYFGYIELVFLRDKYLYSIKWNDPLFEGEYKDSVDQILSTFRFIN